MSKKKMALPKATPPTKIPAYAILAINEDGELSSWTYRSMRAFRASLQRKQPTYWPVKYVPEKRVVPPELRSTNIEAAHVQKLAYDLAHRVGTESGPWEAVLDSVVAKIDRLSMPKAQIMGAHLYNALGMTAMGMKTTWEETSEGTKKTYNDAARRLGRMIPQPAPNNVGVVRRVTFEMVEKALGHWTSLTPAFAVKVADDISEQLQAAEGASPTSSPPPRRTLTGQMLYETAIDQGNLTQGQAWSRTSNETKACYEREAKELNDKLGLEPSEELISLRKQLEDAESKLKHQSVRSVRVAIEDGVLIARNEKGDPLR